MEIERIIALAVAALLLGGGAMYGAQQGIALLREGRRALRRYARRMKGGER